MPHPAEKYSEWETQVTPGQKKAQEEAWEELQKEKKA